MQTRFLDCHYFQANRARSVINYIDRVEKAMADFEWCTDRGICPMVLV